MKTVVTSRPERAARVIVSGGVAAFPTETVYGLGAHVFDEDAVRAVFRAKGRPDDNPLIVHVADRRMIGTVAARIPEHARKFLRKFFPGPLTLVLPKRPEVPAVATAGLSTVGVRMPAHPVAQAFLRACGVPVAAPSANRSGRPSPTAWTAVVRDLGGRIPCVLRGPRATVGLESTVVDCTGRVPVVLRPGAITLEQLQRVVRGTRRATARDRRQGRSPGLRHRHYAPEADVVIRDPGSVIRGRGGAWAYIGLHPPRGVKGMKVLRCRDVEHYARELFHFFRRCDQAGVKTLVCEAVPEQGLGVALMDRIRRAAEGSSKFQVPSLKSQVPNRRASRRGTWDVGRGTLLGCKTRGEGEV